MSTIFRRMQFRRGLIPVTLPPSLSRAAHIPAARAEVAQDHAPDHVREQQAIRDLYAAHVRAYETRDAEPIIALETSDFTVRNVAGRVFSKPEADAMTKFSLSITCSVPLARIDVSSIAVAGDQATAMVTQSLRMIMADKGGRIYVYTEDEQRRDSWVRSSGSWQLRATQTISGLVTIDGHAINKM